MVRLPFHAGIACLVTLFAFASSSHAFPVAYDESVSGELSDSDPLTLFTLGLGANTVKGTISTFTSPPFSDFDSFAFTVPPGWLVTDGFLSLHGLNNVVNGASWRFGTGTLRGQGAFVATVAASPFDPGVPFAGMPAASYNMSMSAIGTIGSFLDSASYTFTFNVIPEPASLSILALGVIPMLRRRRTS